MYSKFFSHDKTNCCALYLNLSVRYSLVLQADVYEDASGACAAFLANMDDKNDKVVQFRHISYNLPAWSVSILPDCKNVVFNTAKVSVCFKQILVKRGSDYKYVSESKSLF